MKKFVDFLKTCEGEAVVCNYNGVNMEQTEIFEQLEYTYDDLGNTIKLSDVEEECYPLTIRLDRVSDIHTNTDSCKITFENGDNFEMYFEI